MDLEALEAMITPEVLLKMPPEALAGFVEGVKTLANYRRYNRIEYFQPFDYQREFYAKGKDYNARFQMAANRIGKTYAGAMEMAYHITGNYPFWWEGKRIEKSGKLFWCIGLTLEMVTDIQQKELLGTSNASLNEDLGTGAIPRSSLILDKGFEKDGARVIKCRIRHKDGGTNTLAFHSSTDGGSNLMGRMVALSWLDEESIQSTNVFSQCIARSTNALGPNENGLIYVTATPEAGVTPLNKMFSDNTSGLLYLQNVTWDDCPLFSEKQKQEMLSQLLPHERELRSKGIPAVGKGAVFTFSDGEITIEEIDINPLPHWRVLGAIDFGHIVDPTTIIIALHDPDNDRYVIYREFVLDQDEESRSPRGVARTLQNTPFRNIPIIVPHDSGLDSDASESNGKLLKSYGVNVNPEPFRNPQDMKLGIQYKQTTNRSVRAIEPGLVAMRDLMSKGKLKVSPICSEWFKEKHSYSYKFNERTQSLGYAGADHLIDASRYAILSLIAGKGCLWSDIHDNNGTSFKSYSAVNLNL